MTTVTFDTLAFVKKLEAKGFKTEQAEGITDALKDAFQVTDLATKADLHDEIRNAELRIIKWVVAVALGQAALIVGLVIRLTSAIN
jgi:hypothetical protein